LLALPISGQLESVARYYQGLCAWRHDDIDNARRSLERVVEDAPPQYRARALQVIGLTYQKRGELDAALPFYVAAGSAAASCDLLTLAESQKMTAVVRSVHGDHKRALADLEKLFPLVRALAKHYPASYYDFLNSLAVELGEVGRVSEAQAAVSIVLASPFAPAYPEWSATRDEIAAKRQSGTPSVVAFNRAPEADPSQQIEPQRKRLPVSAIRPHGLGLKKDSFQRSIVPIAALTATFCPRIIQRILDWMRKRIGPRAPTTFS
jgi:tetratricopeptide (TPR) repeat protein